MDRKAVRRRIAASRFARAAALPMRISQVSKFNARNIERSLHWLLTSREHTNYTYDLEERNIDYLAWWCAEITNTNVEQCAQWIMELESDDDLRSRITALTNSAERRGLSDSTQKFGRRAGWYCLVRALKPKHVVETGTDKGLGSLVLARALERNSRGRLTTIDINQDSGYMLRNLAGTPEVTRLIGDSIQLIQSQVGPVDFFIHDSDHSYEHEFSEFRAIEPLLTSNAIVLSDNSELTSALSDFAMLRKWHFSYFAESPANHWYPGGGIGAAWAGFPNEVSQ